MRNLTKFIYHINRLALLLLAVAFLSFYLVTRPELTETMTPVVTYATQYLPTVLVPVSVAMVVVLLLRFVMKKRNEAIGFDDFLAGILAIAGQFGVIALYRALGSEVLHANFLNNIPDISLLIEKAVPLGILGVAGLQLLTFVLYWIANPDPRRRSAA